MIRQPSGIRRNVKRSDMRTPEPANLPDQFATSCRTTAIDLRYVDAYDSRVNIGRWSISIDPVEQEPDSNGKLIAGVTKERSLRMESGAHHFAVALLTTVNVQLKSFQNRVMFRLGLCGRHAKTIRRADYGHQRTSLAKEGAAFRAPGWARAYGAFVVASR